MFSFVDEYSRESRFEQAYCDLPYAEESCEDARSFFQKEFNLPIENIVTLQNARLAECQDAYKDIYQTLQDSKQKRLYFHILTGHGA